MKILADTNILISAMLYPSSTPSNALLYAARYHELILCDQNISELRRIASEKFAMTISDIEVFLAELAYALIPALQSPQKLIVDPKDAPILNAAIREDVDIIISGDKHFLQLDIERPKPMSPAQFMKQFESEG